MIKRLGIIIMKKTILFVLLLAAVGCGQNLRILWNPASNADNQGLTYYTVYKWEGDSSAWQNFNVNQMDSIGILPHVLNFDGPYEFQTYFDDTAIIRAGCIANDTLGRKSPMAFSRFYFSPDAVKPVWIGK